MVETCCLVLFIVVVDFVNIIQQFNDDVNALQSPMFIRSSEFFSEHCLMGNPLPGWVQKSVNFHIPHGRPCSLQIDVDAPQSPFKYYIKQWWSETHRLRWYYGVYRFMRTDQKLFFTFFLQNSHYHQTIGVLQCVRSEPGEISGHKRHSKHWGNVGLVLVHHLRHWFNIMRTLA